MSVDFARAPVEHGLTDVSWPDFIAEMPSVPSPDSALDEYNRYLDTMNRGLTIDEKTGQSLREQLAGKTVLVTGGTGEIGGRLLGLIAEYGPGRLVSASRLQTEYEEQQGVDYEWCDLEQRDTVTSLIDRVKPDIIFHLAAQRSPGLAEQEVARTLKTNIFGTRNLIEAAEEAGVSQIMYASTGKALRPYSPDVYASSKQAAEWLFAEAAARDNLKVSGVRFTHVVDNAIIASRINEWIDTDQPIRLHNADAAFYAQSAKESAQLCLLGLLESQSNAFNLCAITNLGVPIRLYDMALGAMVARQEAVPVDIVGHETGYEKDPHPLLYDLDGGEISPLISAYERPVRSGSSNDEIDVVSVRHAEHAEFDTQLARLEVACESDVSNEDLRVMNQELSWARLQGKLLTTPARVLQRAIHRINQIQTRRPEAFSNEHAQTNDHIIAMANRFSVGELV